MFRLKPKVVCVKKFALLKTFVCLLFASVSRLLFAFVFALGLSISPTFLLLRFCKVIQTSLSLFVGTVARSISLQPLWPLCHDLTSKDYCNEKRLCSKLNQLLRTFNALRSHSMTFEKKH